MSRKTIAVLHTSPATIDIFKRLLKKGLPEVTVINILDDSILPELNQNHGDLERVRKRWKLLATIAKEQGAQLILNACSSIGELSDPVSAELGVPIVRVDAAMAEEAVYRAQKVGVVATLRSTLEPTMRVLAEAANRRGISVQIVPKLADGAYVALMAGDAAHHDALIKRAITDLSDRVDAIVFAQASMVRVMPDLPESVATKILSSPESAVRRTAELLSGFVA